MNKNRHKLKFDLNSKEVTRRKAYEVGVQISFSDFEFKENISKLLMLLILDYYFSLFVHFSSQVDQVKIILRWCVCPTSS